jgi:hypothetical protein
MCVGPAPPSLYCAVSLPLQITDMTTLKGMGIDTLALADCVSGVFGEMTFCHGFVHCDPHPGNLLVRQGADGKPQLVRARWLGALANGHPKRHCVLCRCLSPPPPPHPPHPALTNIEGD